MTNPILAEKTYTKNNVQYRLKVKGGLHYIKGNSAPYFSITASQYRKESGRRWEDDCGGCCHDLIQEQFLDKFSDLIALHLSDINGAPMYALENAFYHAGGCGINKITEAGHTRYQLERACGDNIAAVNAAMKELGLENAPLTLWERYEGTGKPEVLANHLRIDLQEAVEICGGVIAGTYTKEKLAAYVEALHPRWKREAKACIEKHNLQVIGDAWNPVEAV